MVLTLIDPETRALVEGMTGVPLPDERSPAFFEALDELESRFPALYAQVMATFAGPARTPLKQTVPGARRSSPVTWLWRPVLAGRPVFDARRLLAVALVCGAVCAAPVLVSQLSSGPPVSPLPATLPRPAPTASVSPAPKSGTALDANRNAASTALQVRPPVPSVSLSLPERVLAPAFPVALVRVPQAASRAARPVPVPDAQSNRRQSVVAPAQSAASSVPAPLTPAKVVTSPAPSAPPSPAAQKPLLPPAQVQAKASSPAPGPTQGAAPVVRSVQNVVKPGPGAAAKIAVPVPAPSPTPDRLPVVLKAPSAIRAAPISPVIIRPSTAKPLPGSAAGTDPESALTLYQNGAAPVSGSSGQLTSFPSGGLSASSLPSDQGRATRNEGGLTMYTAPVVPKP